MEFLFSQQFECEGMNTCRKLCPEYLRMRASVIKTACCLHSGGCHPQAHPQGVGSPFKEESWFPLT